MQVRVTRGIHKSFATWYKKTKPSDDHKLYQQKMTTFLSLKRTLPENFSAFDYDYVTSSVTSSFAKRRRLSQSECVTSKRTTRAAPRVRFADPLVQEAEIPAVQDPVDKHILYYSDDDFVRFAFNERIRRDALILTITLCREQQKRLVRGSTAISPNSVQLMYHKILSRRNSKRNVKPRTSLVETKIDQTIQNVGLRVVEKRSYVAQSA